MKAFGAISEGPNSQTHIEGEERFCQIPCRPSPPPRHSHNTPTTPLAGRPLVCHDGPVLLRPRQQRFNPPLNPSPCRKSALLLMARQFLQLCLIASSTVNHRSKRSMLCRVDRTCCCSFPQTTKENCLGYLLVPYSLQFIPKAHLPLLV